MAVVRSARSAAQVRPEAYEPAGMRGIADVPSYVVMQPTTLCNLDCAYCYLPLRAVDRRMPVEVAEAVAGPVNRWAGAGRFSVVWHGGEPLAAGREHLAALVAPFDDAVEHHVQTNATLIDDDWCDFFTEHRIRVSVSVDGPRERNDARVTRGGHPSYDRVLRGWRRCGGTGSASPRSAWCPGRSPAWRPSSIPTFSTLAATCSG
ncbi:hypothetical protein GCM10027605_72400 [Micromonospora zhanjiangensis]